MSRQHSVFQGPLSTLSTLSSTLRDGLAEALGNENVDLDALACLLSSAFDRAALEIDAGADAVRMQDTMVWLVRKLFA